MGAAVQPARGARQAALLLWLRRPKGRGPAAGWICPQPRREPSSPRAESGQPAGGSSPGRPAALPAPSAASPVLAERTGWGSVAVGVASNCVCETTSLHLSTFPGCAVALSPPAPFRSHPKGQPAAPGKAISARAGLRPEVPAALAFIRVKKRLPGLPLTSDQWRFQGWCLTRAYFGVYGGGGRAGSLFI